MPKGNGRDRGRPAAPAKDALTHGTALADAGAVTFVRSTTTGARAAESGEHGAVAGDAHAVVEDGGDRYEVQVAGDPDVAFSPVSWSCPCTPNGGLCGHVVAVALTVYRQQHAEVPTQRGQVAGG